MKGILGGDIDANMNRVKSFIDAPPKPEQKAAKKPKRATGEQILIVDGVIELERMSKEHKKELLYWKRTCKNLTKGYVRQRQKKGSKTYEYWIRVVWDPLAAATKTEYIGKEKPNIILPDEPNPPLTGIDYEVVGSNILIHKSEYDKLKKSFMNLKKYYVQDF